MAKRKKRKKKGAGGSERGVRNISELRTEISYIRTQKETCLFSYKLPLWSRCIVVDRVAAPYFSIIARVRCATGRLFAPISLCRFTPGPPAEFKHKEKKKREAVFKSWETSSLLSPLCCPHSPHSSASSGAESSPSTC